MKGFHPRSKVNFQALYLKYLAMFDHPGAAHSRFLWSPRHCINVLKPVTLSAVFAYMISCSVIA